MYASKLVCVGRHGLRSGQILQLLFLGFIFLLIPAQSFATGSIGRAVAAACAPNPTMPDVGSCSACHLTTNNRGPNDLTAAGMWSLSSATYMNFCPATAPTPTPTPTPPPSGGGAGSPPPGSPTPSNPMPTPGMGGSGASMDDDDDDMEHDDDDDMVAPLRSALSALRSRLRALSDDD